MLPIVTYNNKKLQKMGTVRINDELLEKVKEWIKKNGIKYNYPTISAFVNKAIYEKLCELGEDEDD